MKTKQPKVKIRHNTPLLFIVLLSALVHGGYYNFFAFLCGAVLTGLIVYQAYKEQKILIPTGLTAWCLCGLCLCQLVTMPFAVSAGMAFAGFLRIFVWLLFFVYAHSYTREERHLILDTVAYEGAILALFSIIGFVYDRIAGINDLNGRIDGSFEYANTWALFQLLCLVFLLLRKNRKAIDYPAIGVLLCGIFLSGSRGTLLLLVLLAVFAAGYYAIVKKKLLPILLGLVGVVGMLVLASRASGGMVLERIRGISLSSSTLLGRILYWKDGIRLLWEHPMGLGRGGYLYIQAPEQTGIYILRHVHNEYLQMALDGGILAGVLMVVLVMGLLWKKQKTIREYAAIFLIGAHSLIDFDLQFSAVVFLLLLCGTEEKTKEIKPAKPGLLPRIGAGCLALLFCYVSLGYYLHLGGNYAASRKLLPGDLEIAEDYMLSLGEPALAEPIADEIIAKTDLSMLAWDCKFAAAEQRQDMEQMVHAKYQYLVLNPYRGTVYEEFADVLEAAYAQGSPREQTAYREYAEQAMVLLETVMERTDPLAYEIIDKPDFGFSNTLLARLSQIARREVEMK